MKFAVNYSNPMIRLLKEGAIEIDLIKCPDWAGMLQEAKPYGPVTIHFNLSIGLGQIHDQDLEQIQCFIDETETPHVNAHLVAPRTIDPENPEELVRINRLWRDEMQHLTAYFGKENVLLEHYPYTTVAPHIKPAANAAIFSQVIIDSDCQLLLDLAHARITAATLGIPVQEYIQALPVDRLSELHITGVRMHSGVLTDHFELGPEDWKLFEWALGEIKSGRWRKPAVVAFEYGGVGDIFVWRTNYDVLKSQVPRLMAMVHDVT